MRLTIVGQGRVGRGLARVLRRTGPPGARLRLGRSGRSRRPSHEVEVRMTAGRQPVAQAIRRADVILLAVPDPAIEPTAAAIAPKLGPSPVVLHASGSRSPEVLAACAERGAAIGACHPLASFADPQQPPSLAGVTFLLAGDTVAVRAGRRLARAVGGRALTGPAPGPAYHAAAAMSANGSAALAAVAVRILEDLEVESVDAQRAIGALLRTVAENVENVGLPAALSGPVIRGDAATVRRHREALDELDYAAKEAYDAIAPAILDLAVDGGLPEPRAEAVREALAEHAEETP